MHVSYDSAVCWDGDGTQFTPNPLDHGKVTEVQSARSTIQTCRGMATAPGSPQTTPAVGDENGSGGAIHAEQDCSVSWAGDGTQFSNNSAAGGGGAIMATASTTVSWEGDGTHFISNAGNFRGGAIREEGSATVSWVGDGTQFTSNYARDESRGSYGIAISADRSTLSSSGINTQFDSNSALADGGAIYAEYASVGWEGSTNFSDNFATEYDGALVSIGADGFSEIFGTVFSNNTARSVVRCICTTLRTVPASQTQRFNRTRPKAAVEQSRRLRPIRSFKFSSCSFLDNVASDGGGAVETLAGEQEFLSYDFEGNSAGEGN